MNNCTRSKKLYPQYFYQYSSTSVQLSSNCWYLHQFYYYYTSQLIELWRLYSPCSNWQWEKNKSLISILPYFYFLVLFWWKNTKCAFRQQRSKTPEHLLQNTPPQLFIRVRTNEVGSKAPGSGGKIVNFCLRPAYAFLHNLSFVCFFFHWMRQMKAFHQ